MSPPALLKLAAGAVPAILLAVLLASRTLDVQRRKPVVQHANATLSADEVKLGEDRAAKWIHQYIDEQRPEFAVKILDESFDRRMANSIRLSYLTKVAYFFSYKFDDAQKQEQLAAGQRVNDAQCKEHLAEFVRQMEEMSGILAQMRSNGSEGNFEEKHLRLAKVLDSFGRYEAGFLLGRTHSLGAYTQCKGSQLLLGGRLVASRYCMANLDVSQSQHPSLRRSSEPAEDLVSVAVCLPETCHTKSFKQNEQLLRLIVSSQFELPQSVYRDKHLPLASVFCEIDQDSRLVQIPLSGKLLIAFVLTWCGVTLFSTARTNGQTKSKLLQCFNLRNSWEDFIGAGRVKKKLDDGVSLDTLNPIKVLGCVYVVLGHAVIVHLVVVMDGIRSAKEFEDDPWMFLVAGLTVIVDSFYVITGMIIAYIAMNRTTKTPSAKRLQCVLPLSFCKQCLSFVSLRYLRLVPLYFLVFWFKKSLMPIASSGPLWDYGYNRLTEAGACRQESWWTPFTFQAAYLPLARQCMCQAWSIAGDLFFSIVVAPIVILMTRRPKLAALLSAVICVASNVSLTLGVLGIDANIIDELMEARGIALAQFIKSHSYIYTAPHYRVFSILVGVLAGYVLYCSRPANANGRKRHARWPSWFAGPATKAAFCFAILDLGLPVLAPYARQTLLGHSSLAPYGLFIYVETTGRLLWAISSAIIFLRMVTDWKDNFWMQNSAGQFWSSATKLNYAILLAHMDLLKFDGYMQLNTSFYSRYAILKLFAATYLFCIPLALVLHLLFEHPINKLVKFITKH